MKHHEHRQISELLNGYLDGVLDDAAKKELEDLVSRDKNVKDELDQLRKLKVLLADKKPLEPNIAFWTRLSTRIEQSNTEENLLPFPRRYIPAAAISGFAGILVIGAIVFQNRMSLFHFVAEKTQMVQTVYDQGILKGSILPLLSHIDDNQVLQFSVLGILPLDAKAETALMVDHNSTNGYQIKLGKSDPKKAKPITTKDFYAEIHATTKQKQIIDSLFGLARRRIESSVLVGENEAVAIDPGLAQLNRMMVSNIAASLEPVQRIRFGKYLDRKDAPYTFISKRVVPVNPESVYAEMSRLPHPDRFVVFTPDTVALTRLNVELIREAERGKEMTVKVRGMARHNIELTERLLRQHAEMAPDAQKRPPGTAMPFEFWQDANAVGIQFQREYNAPRWETRQQVVVPLPRRAGGYSVSAPSGRIVFRYYSDSVSPKELLIDSAMVRFFDKGIPSRYTLQDMDSIFSGMSDQFRTQPGIVSMDSVMRAIEKVQRSLFDERYQRRPFFKKEVRVRKEDPPGLEH